MTQEEFAEELGTTRFRVMAWEQGSRPGEEYARKLVALGLDEEALKLA
jgi:DNA-binding transcriptional regulator YiaG